ncbi:hypothetical protein [Vibrio splendidus]|uniref:hypothetical protein n=1 Tax=Vibrio splendidus TaxID=29497 RepID=UPI000D3363FA|nr:hypothetical protein [Vibrio splendidus]PTP44739.1 hypothetical protein CWN87_06025 [Vibrio splendidus]
MKFDDISDNELWVIANPIMDNLMDGSTKVDHAQHCRDFTQRMKDIVTQEYLEKVCHHYQHSNGFFAERKQVALFRRSDSIAFVWKQAYTIAKGEFVAEMVLVEEDGRYLVDHVMVF